MLSIIATPIGNLEDLSPRALATLREVDVLACEDTRRTWALLSHFGIPRPRTMVSYRQGNEERMGARIVGLLRDGAHVALCSDGGYPGISDPGYRLVRAVVGESLPVEVIPGASAVEVALVRSGLPTSSYTFKGYPPRRPGRLRRFFEEERELPHTLVLFESPMRAARTVTAAAEVLGNREAAVCIELTKRHERVLHGGLEALASELAAGSPRGEVTIVIAGANPKFHAAAETDDADGA